MSIAGYEPFSGAWTGPDDPECTQTQLQPGDRTGSGISGMVEQGEHVVTNFKEAGRLRATGQAYVGRAMICFTSEDAQINSVEEFVAVQFDPALK